MSMANRRSYDTVAHGQQTVATAGTSEALNGGTTEVVPNGAGLAIRAHTGNTDEIYVGDGTVSASTGFALGPGESLSLNVSDVADVHIDAAVSGEGVSWIVEVDT